MKIEVNGKPLDLPSGFQISIQETNPIFNSKGSQSVLVELPETPTNNALLGFPGRLDSGSDFANSRPDALVTDGIYIRQAKVNVTEAARRNSISMNLGFDNSAAYQQLLDTRLCDLSSLPARQFPSHEGLMLWISGRQSSIGISPDDDIAVFPVCIGMQANSDGAATGHEILNLPQAISPGLALRHIVRDGQTTTLNVPTGYGVTPFVRVWRVLDFVFRQLNLTMLDNPFRSDRWLANLVVLNTSIDSCVRDSLAYKELMPEVTVGAFLEALWARFGFVYNINYNDGTVSCRFLRDILDDSPVLDLTKFRAGFGKIVYNEPQHLVLGADTSIDGAAPASDRWEDFIGTETLTEPLLVDGSFYQANHHNLIYRTDLRKWIIYDLENNQPKTESSAFFKWEPSADNSALEISSPDRCVPLIKAKLDWASFEEIVPYFPGVAKHYHTRLVDGSDEEADEPGLAFLFASQQKGRPSVEIDTGATSIGGDGHFPTLFYQFRDGLFDQFWRKYDEILRFGNRTFEVDVVIPKCDLLQLDFLRPVTYDGIRCLIDSVSYSLPAGTDIRATVRLRTIQTQGSYNIETLHRLPSLDDQPRNLVWTFDEDNLLYNARSTSNFNRALDLAGHPNYRAVKIAVRYGDSWWGNDPSNSVATFPGDHKICYYSGFAKYSFEDAVGNVLAEVEIPINYKVWLYCVFFGTPEHVEPQPPRDDDWREYDPDNPYDDRDEGDIDYPDGWDDDRWDYD